MNRTDLLQAMKATAIPTSEWTGLWRIVKQTYKHNKISVRMGKIVNLPAGTYTFLFRLTDSTLYNTVPGDVVMEDTPFELSTHLGFVMRAHGRVLVSGLGLGCVVRGLLARQEVEHITCLENSPDVLAMVQPHMPTDPRLTIIETDALEWTAKNREPFDCAWHDLWTDRDSGEPHLDRWHTELLINCRRLVKRQGAWAYNRDLKRKLIRMGFPWLG